MDIITQNTYEVLELVEAGQISAEEVDYLISEGTINPYLFESVLDEMIAENNYLLEESDFENRAKAIKNINIMLQHSDKMTPEKVQSLKAKLASLTNGDENLQKINSLGSQTLWGKGGGHSSDFLKKAGVHEREGIVAHSGDSKSTPEPEHAKGFVDHVIDAYHKGLEHARNAYGAAKETIQEHPGYAGAAAGAAAAGAAGYAAYKYLKNKKAKAGK